jgi:hypothetical protein
MPKLARKYRFLPYLVFIVSLILSGCAAQTSGTGPGKMLKLEPSYKYKIGEIDITDAEIYEVDVKEMLHVALEKYLQEKDMLWDGSPEKKYYDIKLRIVDYEMGNAFKRWLLPTYGSTILSVHTDIIDLEKNEVVTNMDHKQTVAAGGLFSVGAWEYVFDVVAEDIVLDIERKFTGKGSGFFVQLDPWLEKETEAPRVTATKNIYLAPFHDKRPEKNRIGERKAAFNVSMGDIYTNRDVSVYIKEAMQNELLASGNNLSDDKFDISINGELLKFWIWTDTTALYWDIIGEIELKLTVANNKINKPIDKIYKAKSESRTYVYPSKELVSSVISETVKTLMYEIRKDSIWTTE